MQMSKCLITIYTKQNLGYDKQMLHWESNQRYDNINKICQYKEM